MVRRTSPNFRQRRLGTLRSVSEIPINRPPKRRGTAGADPPSRKLGSTITSESATIRPESRKSVGGASPLIPSAARVLMDGMLLTHHPAPPLASYVEALWYYDGYQTAHHKERVLPNGRFQIVIDLAAGPGAVSGMRSQYIVIDTAAIETVMGVVFRPGGARGFFDVPADDFYNQVVPLGLAWGPRVTQLRDRLREVVAVGEKFRVLETALIQAMQRAGEKRLALHPSVEYALVKFRRVSHIRSVIGVTREAGLSRRRFSQLFREQVGITPKLYCRLHRFRKVVRQIASGGPVDWADVALAGGYCDQAHLAHEFREFSGMSPTSYLAAERPFLNHVRMD